MDPISSAPTADAYAAAQRDHWLQSAALPYAPAHGALLVVWRNTETDEIRAFLDGREMAGPLPADVVACAPDRGGVLASPLPLR